MMEDTKGNLSAVDGYLDYVFEVLKENQHFLYNNAEQAINEVIELENDALDLVKLTVTGEYLKRAIVCFMLHVLMPLSYALYLDTLACNLPACFMELRLILESLVKCYLADLKYPNLTFFQDKLNLLEKERQSISKMMKELGKQLGLGGGFITLWGKLSQDLVHLGGFMGNFIAQVHEKGDVAPWAMLIPMKYTNNDLDTINRLSKRISEFRNVLTTAMKKYEQEFSL